MLDVEVPAIAKCPFTGEAIEVRHNAGARTLQGIGKFWMTALYDDDSVGRQELMYDLLTRGGRAPRFSRRPVIKVMEREAPVPDHEAQGAAERREAVDEFIERQAQGSQ